jgi:hypothetical protein
MKQTQRLEYQKIGNDYDQYMLYDESGKTVASSIEGESLAQLLASAPDMLEALKDLLGDIQFTPDDAGGVQCNHCGRFYDEPELFFCPSDDCPSFKARAIITKLNKMEAN